MAERRQMIEPEHPKLSTARQCRLLVIDSRFQKKGLGRWLLSVIFAQPSFTGTVLILWTTDQVGFYRACGLRHEPRFQVMRQAPDWMKAESIEHKVDNSGIPRLNA